MTLKERRLSPRAAKSAWHSVELKLVIGAFIVVLLIFGTGAGFYQESRAILVDADRREQAHDRLDALQTLRAALQEMEVNLQRILAAGPGGDLASYHRARSAIDEADETLREAYRFPPERSGAITPLEARLANWLTELDRVTADGSGPISWAGSIGDIGRLSLDIATMATMERQSLDRQRLQTHLRVRRVVVAWLLFNFASAGGFALSMVLVARQVRGNRTLARRHEHDAHHDFLTGLANRASFKETLDHTIARARREGTRLAVLYMDLNGFKAINDRFGHDMGDRVLIAVAHRLLSVLREADFLARLGGDEFAVIVPRYDQRHELTELIGRIEQEILSLPLPFLQGRAVGISIGVATYPDDGDDSDTLVATADLTMYQAKRERDQGSGSADGTHRAHESQSGQSVATVAGDARRRADGDGARGARHDAG